MVTKLVVFPTFQPISLVPGGSQTPCLKGESVTLNLSDTCLPLSGDEGTILWINQYFTYPANLV